MTTIARLAVLAIPGGAFILGACWLLRCRHANEVLCTRAEGIGLRCTDCGAVRPHPWAGEPVRHRRTQQGGEITRETGISRVAREQAAEQADIEATINAMERRARFEVIKHRTLVRFRGGR